MEESLRKSSAAREDTTTTAMKLEDKTSHEFNYAHHHHQDSHMNVIPLEVENGKKDEKDYRLKPPSPNDNELYSGKPLDTQLKLAKAKMNEERQENERLKMYLDKMMKDYQALQKQFHNTVHDQKEPVKKSTNTSAHDHHDMQLEEPEFVTLSLGRTSSSESKRDINQKHGSPFKVESTPNIEQDKEKGLMQPPSLPEVGRADSCRNASPENSLEDVKAELSGETTTWTPEKSTKTMRSTGDDEVLPQIPPKKARVSVRVRCDTPTMNDGCQWRKYGQKIAKGNPCPRAYYRCSIAPSCPVRKQVQRFSDDMSILITTYEGTHSHPLPPSATAMASSTSAAAAMLLSASSSPSTSTAPLGTNSSQALQNLNFYLPINNNSNNSRTTLPFYIPNTSISTTSSSSCPTITLDLTSSATTSSSSSSRFNVISSMQNFLPENYTSYNHKNYINSSTNLNFNTLESNTLPVSWNYGSHSQLLDNFSRNQINFNYNSFMQQKNSNIANSNFVAPNTQQSLQPDSIEAASKAIASDPNFQSALASALTSIIGSGAHGGGGQNVKSEHPFPVLSRFPSTNPKGSNLRFVAPPLPVSSSKSKSTSPEDN